jgi:hypothetical protein
MSTDKLSAPQLDAPLKFESEKIKLHFAYCSLILTLIIIAIATFNWTSLEGFTVYLGNAATMTSLLLGLVAIFYSFIANDGLSRSLGNINTVTETITKTRDQITGFLELTSTATKAADLSANNMQEFSQSVNRDLTTLNETLVLIKEQSVKLHSSISELPIRFDKLEARVVDVVEEKRQATTSSATIQKIDDAVVKRYLEISPIPGNLLLIACVLAAQTEKRLVIDDLAAAIGVMSGGYLTGFLAATCSAQILNRTFVKNAQREYDITAIHPALKSTSRSYFIEFVEQEYKDRPVLKANWLEKLEKVEALFK